MQAVEIESKKQWFVAYTVPSGETHGIAEISGLGFECFGPSAERWAMRRGRRKLLREPVFPRYLFVRFNEERDKWGKILEQNSIVTLLRPKSTLRPVAVADRVINLLRRADENGVFRASSVLQTGDNVQIQEGPFRDLIGRVRSASPRKRVKILLAVLGGETVVDVDACAVKKLA